MRSFRILTKAFQSFCVLAERSRRAFLLRDYDAVAKEFNAITGRDARRAYVEDRKNIVKEIEEVGLCVDEN